MSNKDQSAMSFDFDTMTLAPEPSAPPVNPVIAEAAAAKAAKPKKKAKAQLEVEKAEVVAKLKAAPVDDPGLSEIQQQLVDINTEMYAPEQPSVAVDEPAPSMGEDFFANLFGSPDPIAVATIELPVAGPIEVPSPRASFKITGAFGVPLGTFSVANPEPSPLDEVNPERGFKPTAYVVGPGAPEPEPTGLPSDDDRRKVLGIPPETPVIDVSKIAASLRNDVEPETIKPLAPSPRSAIAEKAVLISVSLGRLGNVRKVSRDAFEITDVDQPGYQASLPTDSTDDAVAKEFTAAKVDKKLVAANKKILECKEYDAITKHDTKIGAYIKGICLPSPFRSGVYLVSLMAVTRIDKQLNDFLRERAELVDTFIKVYPERVAEVAPKLGPLFNKDDYSNQAGARRQFTMSWQYVTFGTPDALQTISKDIFKREQEKAQQKWAEAEVQVQDLLRAQLLKMTEHMQDILKPDADGTAKRFQKSSLENIRQFIETFKYKDITSDVELEALVSQVEKLVEGVDAEQLRKSDDLRASFVKEFDAVNEKLGAMVENKPKRAIEFDEEPAQ